MSSKATQREDIADIYPLSSAQRGVLYHSLLSAQSGVYVVQVQFELLGVLDHEAFARAWQMLQSRHAPLRTAFAWEGLKEPVQVVGVGAAPLIAHHDWRELPSEDQRQQLAAWAESDRAQSFPLNVAPLMRINVFRLQNQRYQVVWTYHHLLLDGWSLPILLAEWAACYRAARQQLEPLLPPAPEYRDYIAWLSQQEQTSAFEYWQKTLGDFEHATLLGFDSAAPISLPSSGLIRKQLAGEDLAALKRFAKDARVTLGTVIQGAWALLLATISNETDIVFGLARSGRPQDLPNHERRVGLYINTLPIRVRINYAQKLRDWLRSLQQQQLEQQSYEYSALVDVHRASGLATNAPLFESLVVIENYPRDLFRADKNDELELGAVLISEQTNFPLNLYATIGNSLELRLLFVPERFRAANVETIASLLTASLGSFVRADTNIDGATLGDIAVQSESAIASIQAFANDTVRPLREDTVGDQIEIAAHQNPDAIALIAGDKTLDYQSLVARANQLAKHLIDCDLALGDTVAVCLPRSSDLVAMLLAIFKIGARYLPLDPGHPVSRLMQIIDDAQATAIVCNAASRAVGDALTETRAQLIDLDEARTVIAEKSSVALRRPLERDAGAYLIYTSGSTGQPKGVAINHGNLSNLIEGMRERLALTETPRWLAVTTIAFDIAALEIFLPLTVGGTVVLADETTVVDGGALLDALDEHQINVMQATPSSWRLLLQAGLRKRETLTMLCGGEALPHELAQRLIDTGNALWNVYGPTETTIWSSAVRLCEEHLNSGHVPIGAPLANTVMHVMGPDRRLTPRGAIGELWIGGAGVSPGYHARDLLNAERFIDNPLPKPAGLPSAPVLYSTGDCVRQREDGLFEYLGRNDEQIKIRGYRIELGEIEAKLEAYPGVEQAIVVVWQPDTPLAQMIALIKPRGDLNAADLAAALASQLPIYMLPSRYQVVDAMPLNANGKVDRRQLTEDYAKPPAAIGGQLRGETERALAEIWAQVLGVEKVGPQDSFFELGGHSLLLMQAHGLMGQQFATDLALLDLFRYPTLRALAERLDSGDDAPTREQEHSESLARETRRGARAAGRDRLQQRRGRRTKFEGAQA